MISKVKEMSNPDLCCAIVDWYKSGPDYAYQNVLIMEWIKRRGRVKYINPTTFSEASYEELLSKIE